MKPRLKDVAAEVGVSAATVSRVLNGREGVSSETARRIHEVVDRLGYVPPSTRRLHRKGLVGLIVPELTNPVFPLFAQEIETALAARGLTTVLCTSTYGGVPEDEYVATLLDRGVSGMVFVSGRHADTTADHRLYRDLVERDLPLVLVNGYVEGLDALFLSSDEARAVEIAIEHLAGFGHQRIGFASGPRRLRPAERRFAGYRRAYLQDHPDASEAFAIETDYTVDGGAAAAALLLEQGVTGIVMGSDLMALGAYRHLRERGLRIPDDLSIVGYDDAAPIQYVDPPLTTIRQAIPAIATEAADALHDHIARKVRRHGERMFAPELVVRSSTGPPLNGG
jgi:LacI family transcriptional regulator, repressor for deo operon, udp, cdd, tsx, nupC, and nupG